VCVGETLKVSMKQLVIGFVLGAAVFLGIAAVFPLYVGNFQCYAPITFFDPSSTKSNVWTFDNSVNQAWALNINMEANGNYYTLNGGGLWDLFAGSTFLPLLNSGWEFSDTNAAKGFFIQGAIAYGDGTGLTNIMGDGYGFSTLVSPNSQGTNWVLDGSKATYFFIKLTNDCNIQYVTNTAPAPTRATAGVALSIRLLPNGADRVVTLNSNMILLDTNGWTLLTSMNPGLWYQKLTNTANANGARNILISFENNDSTYNQTNTLALARQSP